MTSKLNDILERAVSLDIAYVRALRVHLCAEALRLSPNNITEAARLLNLLPTTFREMCYDYGLMVPPSGRRSRHKVQLVSQKAKDWVAGSELETVKQVRRA